MNLLGEKDSVRGLTGVVYHPPRTFNIISKTFKVTGKKTSQGLSGKCLEVSELDMAFLPLSIRAEGGQSDLFLFCPSLSSLCGLACAWHSLPGSCTWECVLTFHC